VIKGLKNPGKLLWKNPPNLFEGICQLIVGSQTARSAEPTHTTLYLLGFGVT